MKSLAVLGAGLAVLGGCAQRPCSIDSSIDADTCATLAAMQLPDALPADTTNRFADSADAAMLGYKIFFAKNLSSKSPTGCATCHSPENAFTERTPTAIGVGTLTRNAPTVLNAAWLKTIFWDGRVDVLWAQPIASLENPLEMSFSRLELAHAIAASYRDGYEKVFGPLPSLDDASRFPPSGAPGDPAFDAMAADDQEAVNRIAANIGKSVAAYLRKLATGRSAFDAFLTGDRTALTPRQELGMLLFVKHGCANCHGGPLLSDEQFHNAGVPPSAGMTPDRGRANGAVLEARAQFSAESVFSDQPRAAAPLPGSAGDLGAVRTPSLRNVASTRPYMHNGSFETLEEALDFHLSGGGQGYVGKIDPRLGFRAISAGDRSALVDFLGALTGPYPPSPWTFWPNGP